MADSGRITSNPRSYLYFYLDWEILSQDIANNRSRVRLTLKLNQTGTGMWFSANKSGKLQGTPFTYTGGYSGTGIKTIYSRDIWVNHDSDGSKTATFSGSLDIEIYYSYGGQLNTINVSGKANLDRIPRASEINSVSVANALHPDESNTLRLSIDRKYSGFTHLVSIQDGGQWVADWGYGMGTPTSIELNTRHVERLLNRMTNVTSKDFTLRLRTYSGSNGDGYIGQDTMNFRVTVDDRVKPSIGNTYVSIICNQWAIDEGIYVQGQSGVRAEFGSNATGGARVKSRNIRIGDTDGGRVVDNLFRHDIRNLTDSGNITLTYEIIDTRNRKTTATRQIYVHPYSPPSIDELVVSRDADDNTEVEIYRRGTSSDLDGRNEATLSVDYMGREDEYWNNIEQHSILGDFDGTDYATNIPIEKSYTFRVEVRDELGQSASAVETVGTAKVFLSYVRDEILGIGKIGEQGVLDVAGEAYFDGDVFVNGVNLANSIHFDDFLNERSIQPEDTSHFWANLPQGTYFVSNSSVNGISFPSSHGIMVHSIPVIKGTLGTDFNTIWYSQPEGTVYRKSGNDNRNLDWIPIDRPIYGSNSNGEWVRFNNGVQIAWIENITVNNYVNSREIRKRWNLPIEFLGEPRPAMFLAKNEYTGAGALRDASEGGVVYVDGKTADIILMSPDGSFVSTLSQTMRGLVIGRWK